MAISWVTSCRHLESCRADKPTLEILHFVQDDKLGVLPVGAVIDRPRAIADRPYGGDFGVGDSRASLGMTNLWCGAGGTMWASPPTVKVLVRR